MTVAQPGSDAGYAGSTAGARTLGDGIASLGDPSRPGVWVRAPFVEDGSRVEVTAFASGRSVAAEAYSDDGVVQLSLAAYQALEASPADLLRIEISEVPR